MIRTALNAAAILLVAIALGHEGGWSAPGAEDGLRSAPPVLALVAESGERDGDPPARATVGGSPEPFRHHTAPRLPRHLPSSVQPHAERLPYHANAPPAAS
jgi:hypothetical protein